ncbi:hypothetical protein AAMO2058_001660800 [Amorphochlora amoebiformis]
MTTRNHNPYQGFDEDEENLDTGYWIVPMCDFATVASDDSNALIERSDGEIGVVSSRIIESGEAITICPGLFSNDFLLTRFGRLSPDNPHESFLIEYYPTLKTDFKTSEPLDSWAWGGGTGAGDEEGGVIEEWRFELLRLMGHGMEKEKLVEIGKGTQIQHLLTACRILSIDESAVPLLDLQGERNITLKRRLGLGPEVEKKAVEKAIKYLEKTYENYFTTTESQDLACLQTQENLKGQKLSTGEKTAIEYRLIKKRFLGARIRSLERELKRLEISYPEV